MKQKTFGETAMSRFICRQEIAESSGSAAAVVVEVVIEIDFFCLMNSHWLKMENDFKEIVRCLQEDPWRFLCGTLLSLV